MKAFILRLGIVATGIALAASPALAQRPSGGASSGGGDRAVERGGGGGGAPSSGGGSASSGNAGGGGGNVASSSGGGGSVAMSSPSTAAAASPSVSASSNARESAPQHRTGSASSSGQSAAPRSGTRSAPASRQPASANAGSPPRGVGSSNTAQPRNASASQPSSPNTTSDGVPTWSRPRGNRPATDTAVARTVPAVRGGTNAYFYDPFYIDPYYGYGGNGYGIGYYGLNGSPYYYPGFGMGYGFGMGLGWYPYFGDPNGDYLGAGSSTEGSGSYASQGVYGSHEQGNLKLKVKPRDAKVYVDGYFVGVVDQFDGLMQKLALDVGRHKVEIKADGYETAEFDVLINAQKTVTFEGTLKKLQ
jgi:hypothetical protein